MALSNQNILSWIFKCESKYWNILFLLAYIPWQVSISHQYAFYSELIYSSFCKTAFVAGRWIADNKCTDQKDLYALEAQWKSTYSCVVLGKHMIKADIY